MEILLDWDMVNFFKKTVTLESNSERDVESESACVNGEALGREIQREEEEERVALYLSAYVS